MRAKTIIAIVLAILLVIFSLQNTETVVVEFLSWEFSLPQVLLIIGTFSLGVIVGILVSLRKRKKKAAVEEKRKLDPNTESNKMQ
ncbi:MAG: putative membrane protein [Patiriisocius sp.]|jgi:putative membrane protein